MKKILIKILILFSLIFVSTLFFIFFIPNSKFISPAEYKYELLRKTKSPKLILIGGSNVFVGINSEKISNELNINVVNMAFNYTYGLKYMIEQVKDNIYENDILVIIPEQFLFYKNNFNGVKEAIDTIFTFRPLNVYFYLRDFKLFKHIFLKNFNYLFVRVVEIFENKKINFLYLFIKQKYNYELYNKYGDCLYYLNMKAKDKLIGEVGILYDKNFLSNEAIDYLNDFYAKMNKKNVKVIMYSSCLPDFYYLNNKKNLDELDEWMETNIRIPKLTTIEKQTYPYEYFTDTINHLNSKGRDERTDRLINDLKLFLHLKYNEIYK